MILHISYFIFIYLNENLAGFLIMVSPNGPFASNNCFSAKNYQWLVQIDAGWCRLEQLDAAWCRLVQVGVA